MRLFTTPLILASLALAGCASGPSVRVDQDPSADLKAYRTFGFFEHPSTDRGPYTNLMTTRLREATRTHLEGLGYTYDESSPQLRVNFLVDFTDRQELRATSVGGGMYRYRFGAYGPWAGYPVDLDTTNYKAGTLSVDLVDTKTHALVWQGLAEGRVPAKAYQEPGPTIDRVVSEIFQKFPADKS